MRTTQTSTTRPRTGRSRTSSVCVCMCLYLATEVGFVLYVCTRFHIVKLKQRPLNGIAVCRTGSTEPVLQNRILQNLFYRTYSTDHVLQKVRSIEHVLQNAPSVEHGLQNMFCRTHLLQNGFCRTGSTEFVSIFSIENPVENYGDFYRTCSTTKFYRRDCVERLLQN